MTLEEAIERFLARNARPLAPRLEIPEVGSRAPRIAAQIRSINRRRRRNAGIPSGRTLPIVNEHRSRLPALGGLSRPSTRTRCGTRSTQSTSRLSTSRRCRSRLHRRLLTWRGGTGCSKRPRPWLRRDQARCRRRPHQNRFATLPDRSATTRRVRSGRPERRSARCSNLP